MKCDECKYCDKTERICYYTGDNRCVENEKASKQSGWIPVSERLPKDHENVLIYLSSNQITIGLYNSHRLPFVDKPIGWGADAPHGWSSDEVVAWMPLPESYMESEEQECG